MLASAFVYVGLCAAFAGLAALLRPPRWARIRTRRQAAGVMAAGVLTASVLLILPSREQRATAPASRLDEVTPVWQFREYHDRRIAAPPAVVFDAIKRVRPDEIFLFRTLIWIRALGQAPPAPVRDAAQRFESLIDIATHSTFVYLADDPPREFVVGTVVVWPSGRTAPRGKITAELFREPVPPGFALATMNYIVRPDAAGGSLVSTETRVFASGLSARRQFAAYWRLIYPGSALIRRMMLRAIAMRAARAAARP